MGDYQRTIRNSFLSDSVCAGRMVLQETIVEDFALYRGGDLVGGHDRRARTQAHDKTVTPLARL